MNPILAGLIAFAFAAPLAAQAMNPADPSATPPAENMAPEPMAPPADNIAPPADETTTLVERGGKWWNGDREATRDEIAEYKKAKKIPEPR